MLVTTRTLSRDLERGINRLFSDALGGPDWQYRDNAGASWVPPGRSEVSPRG